MEYTGEMMIPQKNFGWLIYGEHYARYMFSSQFVKDKVVLDVASGSGYGTKYLADAGAKLVYGVDISKEVIEYAKKNFGGGGVKFLVGDARELPFKDNFFDVVVSFETIEHLPDYLRFLNEVKRVIKPSGLLIVSTPNKREFRKTSRSRFHLKEFEIEEFRETLRKFFKNIEFLYQNDWVASIVLDKSSQSKYDLYKPFQKTGLYKVVGREPDNSKFIVALCSDGRLPEKFKDTGAIVTDNEYVKSVENYRLANQSQKARIASLKREINEIYSSKAWKVVRVYRKFIHRIDPFFRGSKDEK